MSDIKKFQKFRKQNIKRLGKDKSLKRIAIDFIKKSGKYHYSYNFDWLGMPIIQFPQDVMALQEIFWKIKPEIIIETGVARGGSLIFYASLMKMVNKNGLVIGIDVNIKKHNLKKIKKHFLYKNIKLMTGSSVDQKIIKKLHQQTKNKKIMVVLDSDHSLKHVYKELKLYSNFVSKGSYMIVLDATIDNMPNDYFLNRSWNKNNNPKKAVKLFLKKNKNFVVDEQIENKLLITSAYSGFLKKII